jgi:hypothetical protein
MALLLKIFIAVVLVMIFAEDMRSRSVHWFWFPVLAIGLVALRIQEVGLSVTELMYSAGATLVFLTLQLVLVTAYFSIKHKRITNITEGLLGWGDVLLLVSLTLYLPLLNFIMFYMGSLIIILLLWLVGRKSALVKQQTVPLAGLQAIAFVCLLTYSWLNPALSLVNDHQLIQLLTA